ncbi:hypothetical protein HXX01_04385 [Candidatus Nomurabacteria bacterium]|nr:hypothetical protein [Candidatus Nomurabacteria bacterium]
MKILLIAVALIFTASICHAEDNLTPLVEKLEDISTRIEMGISLNTLAESISAIKFQYRKVDTDGLRGQNPLLDDNLKEVLEALEDYAKVWKVQEVEGYKFIEGTGGYYTKYPGVYNLRRCDKYGCNVAVAGIKECIFDVIKEKLNKAKSLHKNGW